MFSVYRVLYENQHQAGVNKDSQLLTKTDEEQNNSLFPLFLSDARDPISLSIYSESIKIQANRFYKLNLIERWTRAA